MKELKNTKGITLVALVVTIIILLILAGITISQLAGSGLFENAKLAEQKSKEAQEKEEGILADYENKVGEYVDSTRQDNNTLAVKKTVLFSGTANTEKAEYELNDSIENYSFIMIYASIFNGNKTFERTTRVIDLDDVTYQNEISDTYRIGVFALEDWYYSLAFCFTANNKLAIKQKIITGWSGFDAQIYKVVGIK